MVTSRDNHVNGRTRSRNSLRPRKPGEYELPESIRKDPGEDYPEAKKESGTSTIGEQWAARAEALARWTMNRLVKRTDVWGQYNPPDERSKRGKARTEKGTLTRELLVDHFRGAEVSDLIGLHTTSPDNKSRWFAVDIDLHGEPDDDRKQKNQEAAKKLFEQLRGWGLNPLLYGSNGRGGYHLVVVFDRPVSTSTVHAFGESLLRDWESIGLDKKPDLFPMQPKLEGGKSTGTFFAFLVGITPTGITLGRGRAKSGPRATRPSTSSWQRKGFHPTISLPSPIPLRRRNRRRT